MLKGCQINVTYQAIGNNAEPKKYPIHPLGLVVTDDGIYLLCTIKDRTEVSTLHLRRFVIAEPTNTPINIPVDFDIDKVASTSFHIKRSEKPVKLKMRISKTEAKRLEEAPINQTQKISTIDEQWSTVSVATEDSDHLRRWIQSLGKDVEVLAPEELRAEFLSTVTAEMIEMQAELERLEGQVLQTQEIKEWSNWVKTFQRQIETYRKFSPHQRKDVLQKLLTFVDVHLIDNQTHWLEIQFKVPLVGDLLVYKDPKQKDLGYSLKDGVTALMVEQVSRPYSKKKPIETKA